MKNTFLSLLLIFTALLTSSAFIIKSSNGIQGYAASPGEGTCSSCHSGGSSASSGITITAVPEFSTNINSETEYMPDSLYQISIEVSANGFSKYGFASQILNPSATNAGTLQNQGSGVKFMNAGQKRTATHTTAKNGNPAIFTYKWKAPSNGDATIYAIGNAVNGNGSTSGDFVITPVSLNLVPAPVPVDSTIDIVNVKEIKNGLVSQVSVFPNPALGTTQISYYLETAKHIHIELVTITGSLVKSLYDDTDGVGQHSQILNLQTISSGVYFIKLNADSKMASQKLIVIP